VVGFVEGEGRGRTWAVECEMKCLGDMDSADSNDTTKFSDYLIISHYYLE
jgi:hypothetical protein